MKLNLPTIRAPRLDWRSILARLPLPMLALAASYGVYSYALLFVPEPIAIIQAAAFETTYIGLAVTRTLDAAGRRRATAISLGAVTASIIYNTLAGWFHAQPQILIAAGDIAWLCLAVLHGAPLAWVAFLVASLLLHQQGDLDAQIANDRQLLASTTADLAIVRESETALRERLASIEASAASDATEVADLRAQLASDKELLASGAGDLAVAREETAQLRERLASSAKAVASESTEAAAARERAANADATLADREREIAHLREELAEAREQVMIFGETPPTQARVLAYVREQMDEGRALLDIARELGFSESTVRGWVKAATNGHLVEE